MTYKPEDMTIEEFNTRYTWDKHFLESLNWDACPKHCSEGLKNYVINRINTGGFLHAVLINDLFGAFSRADPTNRNDLHDIIMFIYNELPVKCYGTQEKYEGWLRQREWIE